MIAIFAHDVAVLIGLVLVVALVIAVALAFENDQLRVRLRRFAWFRRLELLPPSELRYRGMVSLGVGICCFAALMTLQLFQPVPTWTALTLGIMAVLAVTLGAALLERAG